MKKVTLEGRFVNFCVEIKTVLTGQQGSLIHLSTIHLKVPIKVENISKFEHSAE